MEPVISLRNIAVRYRKPEERITSLKEYAIRRLRGHRVGHSDFWALRGITFDVVPGEVMGIIGQNGAGKSTLLKIVARVMRPTLGSVRVRGKVAPLLELGAGFDPELTGRENIYLNGAILGFSKYEMDRKFERIVDFAELHNFIDAPLRTYSTGMVARLGFAIATDIEPDVLLLDEILTVGDERFQEKCKERIQGFRRSDTTIVLVSHSGDTVRALCDRALWLERGQVQALGDARQVAYEYKEFLFPTISRASADGYFHPDWVVTRAEFVKMLVVAKGLPLVIPDQPTFTDVPIDAWYYPYVETALEYGIVAGYGDLSFGPNQPVGRAEAAKMAVSASGYHTGVPSSAKFTFTDVPPDAWSYPYIETAFAHDLFDAEAGDKFRPDESITRAEAVKLMVRLGGYGPVETSFPTFADVPRGSPYFTYVETAHHHGIVGNYTTQDSSTDFH